MSRSTDNIIVGNDIRNSGFGIFPVGGDSLYAHNVLVNNRLGIVVTGEQSVFIHNVIVGNDIGVRAGELVPSNWFVRNDVVGNDIQVESKLGPLRTWTHNGVGNYWGELPLVDADDNGVYDRGYQPTGTIDSLLGETAGAATLAHSPAAILLRRVRNVVPGLRNSGVIDMAPRTEPFHPEQVAEARANETAGGSK